VDDYGMDNDAPFQGLDPREPNIARVYDAFLGGKDNYAADREVAARLAEISPEFVQGAHDNRAFIGRAVTWAAGRGIHQFLDLGSGLPTHPAVHEFVREAIPDARVCYVTSTTYNHTWDEVASFFAGLEMAPPGLVRVTDWRASTPKMGVQSRAPVYPLGGVAVSVTSDGSSMNDGGGARAPT
jgi:S-adenosyl methyltransferase